MTKHVKWLFGAFIALSGFNPVLASILPSQMQVTATVTPGCSGLQVSSLSFGAVPASNARPSGTATITVFCAQGVPYDITLSNGNNDPVPFYSQARRMSDGAGNFLDYDIFVDPEHAKPWHDGIAINTFKQVGIGNGSAQQYTAYGEARPQTSQAAGNYSDSVEVDLNF